MGVNQDQPPHGGGGGGSPPPISCTPLWANKQNKRTCFGATLPAVADLTSLRSALPPRAGVDGVLTFGNSHSPPV